MKIKLFSLVLMLFACSKIFAQVAAVDPKGTKVFVDSSKWKITGNNISNKNTGNVGIGTTTPLFKLDIAATNPLRLQGLQNGNPVTDSLVSTQNGVIKKLAPIGSFIINRNDSTTASNGLNLNGKDVRLGGNLTQATTITNNANPLTIATGGSALNITGLTNGTSATDSLMVVQNGAVRKLAPISTFIVNRNDSTTASNGLILNGKDVRLGGNLIQSTTVTNNSNALTFETGGTAFNITGLPNGTTNTDSLVVVRNGTVRKLAPLNSLIANKNDSTTASNGLNLNGKDVRLGGNLTQPTTITNNTNPLTIATGGTALNITGLTNGTSATDSLMVVQNGAVRKLAPISTFIVNRNDSTTASNGLNLNGKDVRLGGNLTQPTTITNNANPLTIATGGTALNITGLTNGTSATDSLMVVQNGAVRKLAPISTFIVNRNDSTTASNGLNLNGKDVRLGGNLTQPTTITNNANPLTIATGGTALNITGLTNGTSATDSLMVVQNGAVRKLAPISTFIVNRNDSTTASNGLNLNGKDVRLGGNLTQPTTITNNANPLTIATGGTALNITGLTNGTSATDSLMVVQNGAVRKLAPISTFIVNRNDSTTASNGLNLNGKDVRLGGNLTQPTTITNNANPLTIATGGTALNITGLTNGTSATDSLMVVQNGAVRKLAPISTFITNRNDSTTASNGLNLNGKDVRLGGNLTQPTIITSNANPLTIATGGTALNITGLTNGTSATDSLMVVQNGAVRKLAPISTFIVNRNDSTTASNGLNLNGKDVRLGGNLTQATTITSNANPLTIATGGTALNITGLTNGTSATDSLMVVQNGAVRKLAPISTFIVNRNDSTTASNGLNLNGKDVRLGGNLTQPTTITNNTNPLTIATGGTALNITGLTNGTSATDSLMVVQNGAVRKLAPISTFIVNRNDSTTASNGLNLNGKDVRLGGNLTQATTITSNANPLTIATGGTALNITGLTNGASATDSLMVVQNGAVRKLAPIATFIVNRNDSTTASNGLNLNGKDVRLGGNLTQPTTITNNANPLTIATGGTALNITGLPGGNTTDSIVTVNNATGQLRKISATELQGKVVEIFDAAGTQVLTTTFANLNLGTTNIADNGFTAAGGTITVANAGVYRITMRATVRVTTNNSSGGEFRITAGGVAIPGTLGYTYQHNANRPYGTVTIVKITSLDANTVVAAQGRRYSANGNLVLAPDGSSLSIEKIR